MDIILNEMIAVHVNCPNKIMVYKDPKVMNAIEIQMT